MTKISSSTDELVINWHITEACNYGCRYCYAKWEKSGARGELVHDAAATTRLLKELAAFFSAGNPCHRLDQRLAWKSLRLNIAGGEPLLYRRETLRAAREARRLGFDVSLITNASCLDEGLMRELAGVLTMLGVSLDSTDAGKNRQIGRSNRHGHVLAIASLTEVIALGRRLNPSLKLKINTVVNALNHHEYMAPEIRALVPAKWKVLRMLPSVTDELAISAAEFEAFVARHLPAKLPICAEDNGDMTESYIMVDPHGRFFQNASRHHGYRYSEQILKVGAAAAFANIRFSASRYLTRYASGETVR